MINSILLTNFTGFANNRFDFTEGVNVLIGKNGTGKTHVLKCLAATLQHVTTSSARTLLPKSSLSISWRKI